MRIANYSILFFAGIFAFSEEGSKHKVGSTVQDKNYTIEMADPPPPADFKVELTGPENVKTIGRKSESGSTSGTSKTGSERPTITADENAKQEEEKKKKNSEETKKYTTFVNYGGKDGWLTTQVDQSGNAVSANFNTQYDASGNSGQNVSVNYTGNDGTKANFNKEWQNQVALGKASGTLNGVPVKETGNSPPSGGGG